MHELAATFMDARNELLDPDEALELARCLDAALATARASAPQVTVPPTAWISGLAESAPKPFDRASPLGSIILQDHYLAFACAAGDPHGVTACDAILVREARFAADAARLHASLRDEAIQIVRTQLFAPRPDRPPAIRDYAGRGALRSWLRVSVSRELVRLSKAQNRHVELEDQLMVDPGFGDDPALEALKSKYRAELATAFRTALTDLPPRERTLLRYQVVDGLTVDEIGTIFRVHRATAARWIAKIRDDLVARTRALVGIALGVDTEEAASIVRLVQSQLDVSVIKHLGPGEP